MPKLYWVLKVQVRRNSISAVIENIIAETKPEDKKLEMREGERSCENCGNTRCAIVANIWDECADSNFTKHWMPKEEEQHE
ncbi:hypothetical protein EOM81_10980 [bacterium]|nr:hypothetical protein [bacterium]